ncbi:MAG: aldo/keto reductase [Clostridia bacterium]|nr:aldo/keto reductase [Clostridia bacterium]
MKPSRMTLGTVQLGLDYGINNKEGKPSLEKAFRILDHAFLNGINTFDTAAGYGESEKVIGQYFNYNKAAKDKISIVTKFKLGEVKKEEVRKKMFESVEASLMNIGVNKIKTLLMHDAKEYQLYQKEIDEGFSQLIEERMIEKAGASAYSFEEMELMLGNELYTSFQLPVNMLDQRITNNERKKSKLIKKTIYVRSIYLQGIFFKDPNSLTGNLAEVAPFIRKVQRLAEENAMSIAELAMRYVNSLDYVDSLVIGCDNEKQVEENAILTEKEKFSSDKMTEIEQRLAGVPEWVFYPMYWDKQK